MMTQQLFTRMIALSLLTLGLTSACSGKQPAPAPSDDGATTEERSLTTSSPELPEPDPCALKEACKRDGLCETAADGSGQCIAKTDAQCQASASCAAKGECVAQDVYVPYCKCDAESEEEAEARCGEWQRGGCSVTDESCKASQVCKERGACTAYTWCGGHACVTKNDADCAASTRCKTHGECAFLGSSSIFDCAPTTAEHCKQAQVCTKEGRCALGNGVCL